MLAVQHVVARTGEGVRDAALDQPEGSDVGSDFDQLAGGEFLPSRVSSGREQLGDLIEAERGSLTEDDDGQAVDHLRLVLPPQTRATNTADEPVTLVEVQRRGREAGAGPDLADVQKICH